MSTGGTIGALTYGVVDRVEFYAQPTCLSLAPWSETPRLVLICSGSPQCKVPFLNADAYGIQENPLYRGPA